MQAQTGQAAYFSGGQPGKKDNAERRKIVYNRNSSVLMLRKRQPKWHENRNTAGRLLF